MNTDIAIVRGGTVDIPRRLLSLDEIAADKAALSCLNPDYTNAARLGKVPYGIPETVSSLILDGDNVRYPIAAARVYRTRLREKGLVVVDERPVFDVRPTAYRGELFQFQRAAVDALVARTNGIVTAPCGAGKTEIIAAAIGEAGMPALVLQSALDLAREVRERLAARLGVDVGLVGGGTHDVKPVTVGVVQALSPDVLAAIAPLFGVVVRDECHHAAAPSERTVLAGLQARRWYGVTATLERADGLTPFVHHFLGPEVYRVTRAKLVAAGRSQSPQYRQVATDFRYAYKDRDDWVPLLRAIEHDDARNTLLVDVVARDCAGELAALLLGRVAHVEHMVERLRARDVRAVGLTGQMTKRAREAALAACRAGEADVIVGTSILDEGLDVPALARIVLGWPGRSEARLVQRVGRALRVLPGKSDPIVFDVVDEHVGVLNHQARARARIFERAFTPAKEAA